MTYIGRIRLPLTEYDLYWFIVTLTGRICSQSKVFCRSALLCRFNIPHAIYSYLTAEQGIAKLWFLRSGNVTDTQFQLWYLSERLYISQFRPAIVSECLQPYLFWSRDCMETDVENSDGRFTKQEIIVFDSLQSTDWLNIACNFKAVIWLWL